MPWSDFDGFIDEATVLRGVHLRQGKAGAAHTQRDEPDRLS